MQYLGMVLGQEPLDLSIGDESAIWKLFLSIIVIPCPLPLFTRAKG